MLCISDIVFVRTWFTVEVPQLYNPVTTLLLPQEEKARWTGMKTVGQLRREKGLQGPLNKDSLYKVTIILCCCRHVLSGSLNHKNRGHQFSHLISLWLWIDCYMLITEKII